MSFSTMFFFKNFIPEDRRKKIHMCSHCGDLHYVDSDDDEFYEDDDDYFEDDDYYYDNLPCDDDEDSVVRVVCYAPPCIGLLVIYIFFSKSITVIVVHI